MPAAVASPGSASAEGQESGSGDGNNNTANSSIIVRPRRRRTLFFHDEDCQQVCVCMLYVCAVCWRVGCDCAGQCLCGGLGRTAGLGFVGGAHLGALEATG